VPHSGYTPEQLCFEIQVRTFHTKLRLPWKAVRQQTKIHRKAAPLSSKDPVVENGYSFSSLLKQYLSGK